MTDSSVHPTQPEVLTHWQAYRQLVVDDSDNQAQASESIKMLVDITGSTEYPVSPIPWCVCVFLDFLSYNDTFVRVEYCCCTRGASG